MAFLDSMRSRRQMEHGERTLGMPGVGAFPHGGPGESEGAPAPELLAQTAPAIGEREVGKAIEILTRYKEGKANLEERIVEDELWYQLRHQEVVRRKRDPDALTPTSAWLFNSIASKHADAMDNYPEANVLPRERGDERDAKLLASILPVVLEHCDFEETYSANWWEKLKHGTGVYGVFWDPGMENGLGDINITRIDLLNIFWEPGIADIQKSRNLFVTEMVDNEVLSEAYPQLSDRLGGDAMDAKQYIYDDAVDTSDKSLVVDWYYKRPAANGRTILHYAKFVGRSLLFASENDARYRESGWYEHGKYPFVFDTLFPEKGTPVGFGYVAICKDPQLYIDKLGGAILENAVLSATPRYFQSSNSGVNEAEFLDAKKKLIHVEGDVDERGIQKVQVDAVPANALNVYQIKIDEMKETSGNRDFSQGSAGSGVTAAAAIAALQEAGNKGSRDMISGSYRAYAKIDYMVIDLFRQFYDEARSFRITGSSGGDYQFVEYSNAGITDQVVSVDAAGLPLFRRPVFDIKIKAQKRSPMTREVENQRATELYGAGLFNPERAQEAVIALEMMEFEGKDKVMEQVRRGQTLLHVCQQMAAQMDQMAMLLGIPTAGAQRQGTGEGRPSGAETAGKAMQQAQTSQSTPYAQRMAARAVPDMNRQSGV